MKVYWASKLHHADRLKKEQQQSYFQGMEFSSSWTSLVGHVEDTEMNAKTFWIRNLNDIAKSDYVILYAQSEDKLKGALFEAGFAFAAQKTIIIIGEHPDYSTWQFLGQIFHAVDFRHAAWMIRHMEGS